MWSIWPAVLAQANFVLHSVGWLQGGLTVSYEKMIIDMENLAMFQHFLQDVEISDETLALDMIAEVGPGGHHLGTPHTQARYKTEFYSPFWRTAGAMRPGSRAGEMIPRPGPTRSGSSC